MARAEKVKQIKESCAKLAKSSECLQVEDITAERIGRHFQTGSLMAAANCFDFGKKRYRALTARRTLTFALCVTCKKVFNGLTVGSKHRCQPAGGRQLAMQRQRQPQEQLRGGEQLATQLLHPVTVCTPNCLAMRAGND